MQPGSGWGRMESAPCLPLLTAQAWPRGAPASRATHKEKIIILAAETEARTGKFSLAGQVSPRVPGVPAGNAASQGASSWCSPCVSQALATPAPGAKGPSETRKGKGLVQGHTAR